MSSVAVEKNESAFGAGSEKKIPPELCLGRGDATNPRKKHLTLLLELPYTGSDLLMGREPMATFGEKLQELRLAAELTQAALADASSVPLGTIREYEQGKRDPLLSNAQRLAHALGRSLDVFNDVASGAKGKDARAEDARRKKIREGDEPWNAFADEQVAKATHHKKPSGRKKKK